MSEVGSERSKSWNIYTTPDRPSPSSQTGIGQEVPWKNFGSSMNAISFGFVATAVLISMFLIMAIFEHLFRPTSPFSSHELTNNNSADESGPVQKFATTPNTVSTSYASDLSVLMPGQHIPTFIAQPAPLPCQRERVYWPSHDQYHFSGPN